MMDRLVKEGRRKVFRWCIWDVIENCQDDCSTCTLRGDCQGKAHAAEGFVPVSDVRTMRDRVGDKTWQHEVLCDSAGSTRTQGVCKWRRY